MLSALALSAAVGILIGSRCRAAMLLMASLLVLMVATAAHWDELAEPTATPVFVLLEMWLWLAALQLGFVVGACASRSVIPDSLPAPEAPLDASRARPE